MATKEKKQVKRIMRKIMKYTLDDNVYYLLIQFVDNEDEQKNKLSEEECKKIRKKLLKKIKKQLEKEHSLLVTARLVMAYHQLDGEKEDLPKTKYVKGCTRVYGALTDECFSGSDSDILKIFKELDRLTN